MQLFVILLVFYATAVTVVFGASHGPKASIQPMARSEIRYTSKVRLATTKIDVIPGRWKMIICHHSAIKNGNAAIYERDHRRRGMENGLAYHFLIGNGIDSGDGEIEVGTRWIKQIKGGHVRSEEINEVAIGICLVGNFDKQKPTKRQVAALKELLTYLRNEVVGRKVQFMVHTEADPRHTACPGKYFPTKSMHRIFD